MCGEKKHFLKEGKNMSVLHYILFILFLSFFFDIVSLFFDISDIRNIE